MTEHHDTPTPAVLLATALGLADAAEKGITIARTIASPDHAAKCLAIAQARTNLAAVFADLARTAALIGPAMNG
ncbi:hypothetical protein ACFW1A_14760 [Kitasatospora sp. NPDC058965]|uniref:hypothetical protein n=1 Tax=Kitasatospora sp. NPDC058965 TaxID=3346682 RepID=UPI003678BB24